MTITPERKQALQLTNGQPLRMEDSENHAAYVMKGDAYAKMQAIPEEDKIDPSFFEIDDFEPAREDS